MSTYEPERWYEAIYITAPVWSVERFNNDLDADGFIWGIIYDSLKGNGAVVQFPQGKYHLRQFVTFEHLEKCWSFRSRMFLIEEAQYLECVVQREYDILEKVLRVGCVVRNRLRVPVWTQFR